MVFVGQRIGRDWHLMGTKKSYFDATLKEIVRVGSIATGDLAKVLDISLQNCSNRLAELGKRRLVQREKEFGVRGGQTHANRSLLNLAE
jgi:Mn-dependent DtxR family transcriptional regulator